jgi:hypothetical protein
LRSSTVSLDFFTHVQPPLILSLMAHHPIETCFLLIQINK